MPNRIRFTLIFLLWVGFITFSSLTTVKVDGDIDLFHFEHLDKIVHFTFYFGFVVLALFSSSELWPSATLRRQLPKIALLAITYGLVIELLQHTMTDSRSADFYDVIANGLGAFTATLLIIKYRSLIPWLK